MWSWFLTKHMTNENKQLPRIFDNFSQQSTVTHVNSWVEMAALGVWLNSDFIIWSPTYQSIDHCSYKVCSHHNLKLSSQNCCHVDEQNHLGTPFLLFARVGPWQVLALLARGSLEFVLGASVLKSLNRAKLLNTPQTKVLLLLLLLLLSIPHDICTSQYNLHYTSNDGAGK